MILYRELVECLKKSTVTGVSSLEIQEDEFDASEIFKIIKKRRLFIVSLAVVSALFAAVLLLATPKIYQAEAIINIPYIENTIEDVSNTDGPVRSFSTMEKPLLSVSESRVNIDMAVKEWKNSGTLSTIDKNLVKAISTINVEPIASTEVRMKLTISLADSQEFEPVFSQLLRTLNDSKLASQIRSVEKKKIESRITVLRHGLAESLKTKEKVMKNLAQISNSAFNPVAMDLQINNFQIRLTEYENMLVSLKNYDIVDGPYLSKNYIDKKIAFYSFLSALVGLFTALFISFGLEGNIYRASRT